MNGSQCETINNFGTAYPRLLFTKKKILHNSSHDILLCATAVEKRQTCKIQKLTKNLTGQDLVIRLIYFYVVTAILRRNELYQSLRNAD